jgi:membrane-bound lytic murein transglycosylase B
MLRVILLSILLLPLSLQAAKLNKGDYRYRADVEDFIRKVAASSEYNESELIELFSQVKNQRQLFERMDKPAEILEWHQYRKIFLTDKRINAGIKFWKENRVLISQVEKDFQIPAEIIVAIVGIETFYGQYKGKSPVFDTLVTFAFDYPKRAEFFTRELEQFLILSKENQLDTRAVMGSYAGAMGMPQFIASSYRSYAVDGDGDGKANLFESKADILTSVANYFKKHGWVEGQPIAYPISLQAKKSNKKIKPSMKPDHSWKDLVAAGFSSKAALDDGLQVALLKFEQEDHAEYWAGLQNFYVITRYNHSPLYAMAVYQLSQKLKQGVE